MRREAILDVAIRVLLTNNGASLHDIASAAGVGRTTLHRYFPTREDLLLAIGEVALRDAEKVLEDCHMEDGPVVLVIERVIGALLPLYDRFQFLLRFEEQSLHMGEGQELHQTVVRLIERFDAVMRRGQEEGLLRRDLPVRWLNDMFMALIFAAADGIRMGWTAPREAPRFIMTSFLAGAQASADHTQIR